MVATDDEKNMSTKKLYDSNSGSRQRGSLRTARAAAAAMTAVPSSREVNIQNNTFSAEDF